MSYTIEFGKSVQKFLQSCDYHIKVSFITKIQILKLDPYNRNKELDIKLIKGPKKNIYRLRISSYRFIYEIIDNQKLLIFFAADSRGGVYK